MSKIILGIDIGGSGIKGAPVDLEKGCLAAERYRIPTPAEAHPEDVTSIVSEIVKHFGISNEPVGCCFPAAIRRGVALTAANIDPDWIDTNVEELFSKATNCHFSVLNDADAAGIAMLHYGNSDTSQGTVLVVTVGTGLGTALFVDGKLVPNMEFGHIEMKGKLAEHYASDATRKRKDLSWKKWGKRFNKYLQQMERLIWPERIIIGGGMSRKGDRFLKHIKLKTPVETAALENEAGIIGAALAAWKQKNGQP